MNAPRTAEGYVGRRMRKLEDPHLLSGRGRFVDDVRVPGMVHAAFLRSPVARARITAIDTSAALETDGVFAVFTADDLDQTCSSWRGLLNWPGMIAGEQRALSRNEVRYVGEPVALVIAGRRAIAEDAVELIRVEYTDLPAVVDPVQALMGTSPLVHEELGTNLAFEATFGEGDIDEAFGGAAHTVDVSMSTGRHTAVAIEPRGVLADADAVAKTLTVRLSTQAPHMLQATFAKILNLAESSVRVITEDVGGAFGMKAHVYPDEVAVCAASLLLGRPVKWIQDRVESLQADTQARDERIDAALALDSEGKILGLKAEVISDGGAYSVYPRGMVTEGVQVATIMPGPYRVPVYRGHLRVAMTNKPPLAVYRGVGHPVAILVMESLMDEAARIIGVSGAEVRRRNLIEPAELPYTSVTGYTYDSGSHQESLERLVARMDTDAIAERKAKALERGRLLGLGLAAFVEVTAPGAMFYGAKGAPITAHDQMGVRVEPDGTVTVALGTPGQGQGLHTTAAQVVADRLGVDIDSVRVVSGDTRAMPHGSGVWASRSAVVSSGAAVAAAADVRSRLLAIAGHLLEASVDDLTIADGVIAVRGAPHSCVTIQKVAETAYWRSFELPSDIELSLAAVGVGHAPPVTFNNGTHAAVVEIDPDLGLVSVLDYQVVEDCGVLINPDIVDGQIRGGIAQGIGGALFEQLHYDQDGQLLTSTLLDYHLPTAAELPDIGIQHIETPSPLTALGTKGVGEAGAAGAPAAIHNAVNDALAQVGARVWHQPITPERIVQAVTASQQQGSPA